MKLIHSDGTVLRLSQDLLWVDEFAWSDLAQTEPERTLSGSYIVQQGVKRKGRPISLEPPDESMAWHTREVVETLQQWAMQPEMRFTLDLGRDNTPPLTVIFDNASVAVSATPVIGFNSVQPDTWFRISLKFLTA